jgi:hypothetical protein
MWGIKNGYYFNTFDGAEEEAMEDQPLEDDMPEFVEDCDACKL